MEGEKMNLLVEADGGCEHDLMREIDIPAPMGNGKLRLFFHPLGETAIVGLSITANRGCFWNVAVVRRCVDGKNHAAGYREVGETLRTKTFATFQFLVLRRRR